LKRATLAWCLALLACAPPTGSSDSAEAKPACPVLVSDGQYLMGTVLEASVCASDRAAGEARLRELFEGVRALEKSFTTFDPASEVSALNRSGGRGPQPASAPLLRLTADSVALSAVTRGTFDVTVGPLVALWKAAGKSGRRPSEVELAAARAKVGAGRVTVDPARGTIALESPGVALDFGGVAKGWALDRALERLRAAGVTRALLSFGESSIAAIGAPRGADGWGVALGDTSGGFLGTVELRDASLSVSGALGQYVEIEGIRYGHVIDPRSGEPLERARVAVVLAADGARAEALSKALLILGENEGIALVESLPDAEGLLRDENGESFETSGWRAAARWSADWPGRE
jgi:thiamine biosynthesis lipoprotein